MWHLQKLATSEKRSCSNSNPREITTIESYVDGCSVQIVFGIP